ncbi:MAG: diguanylate cyclase [FCB group bacterium]|nr:diguanylate cyclase [FCB group bacterium]
MNHRVTSNDPFLAQVDIELQRAERYRIFISLIVLDLSFIKDLFPHQEISIIDNLMQMIGKHIRAIDNVSKMEKEKLALLFPETTRQGAEIASKRIVELVKGYLSEIKNKKFEQIIPLEMASYPDAAGAKSITDFLKEYSEKNRN